MPTDVGWCLSHVPLVLARFSILAVLLVLEAGSAWAQASVDIWEIRFRVGDDMAWARPDLEDGDWERRSIYAPPDTAAVMWARFDVGIDDLEAAGVDVSGVAAREVYWDGVRIGQSGTVGTDRETERVGPIDAVFPIPDSLATPGTHLLALRLSTFRRHPSIGAYIQNVRVGDLRTLTAAPLLSIGIPLVFLGGFMLVAVYYGVLFLTDRRRTPYLLTALLCLAVGALLVSESWRAIFNYDYDLHVVRLRLISGLTCAVGFLLSTVFESQFDVPRGRAVLAALALAIGVAVSLPTGYDGQAMSVFVVSIPVAFAITVWAVVRRKPGALFAAAGVAVCLIALIVTRVRFLDAAFFPSFSVLMAGLLASLGLQARDERQRHQAALAETARLEAELLKKHLQPHFLMNTLTSILEWVETDPATGARALEALAEELRALSDISGERLISVGRELALCRAHLEVMSFRREVQFVLEAEGVDLEGTIPPAVLHTLVENAITHNAYPPGTVQLRLSETRDGDRRTLTLRAPLAGPPRDPDSDLEGGGLRYIRGRLEESVTGRWALSSSVEDGDWVTRISLPVLEAGSPLR